MPSRPLRRRRWSTAAVRQRHLSGKFSRSANLLRAQVEAAAAVCDIITLTEVDHASRGQVLADLDGFTLVRGHDGPAGESAILVRTNTWRVRAWSTELLVDDVPAARSRIVVPIALLEHIASGATLLLSPGHMPAGVEGSWKARTARVVAHLACVRRWRRLVRRWRRRYGPDAVLVVADWNLNLLRLWVRAWARTSWPSLRPPRRKNTGTVGDLGRRLISWPLGRHLLDLTLRVLAPDPASDHRGVELHYVIRTPEET